MSLWGNNISEVALCVLPILAIKPNKKFMAMFVGFLDGDGYFDIGEQKQYNKKTKTLIKSTIRLRLASNVHVRDIYLLKYFVKVLGVGKISKMSGEREQVRVIFSKKDLISVILPLIKEYDIKFLTSQRLKQFTMVNNIIENAILHWEDILIKKSKLLSIPDISSPLDLINLDFFGDWLVGFTIAEGSFGMKISSSAFYQIKQTGAENKNILKAACLKITGREAYTMKADSVDSYQLSLTSKSDIGKVVNFFSFSNYHSMVGYKLSQYKIWIKALKNSRRYSSFLNNECFSCDTFL